MLLNIIATLKFYLWPRSKLPLGHRRYFQLDSEKYFDWNLLETCSAVQAASHKRNQCWHVSTTHICITLHQLVNNHSWNNHFATGHAQNRRCIQILGRCFYHVDKYISISCFCRPRSKRINAAISPFAKRAPSQVIVHFTDALWMACVARKPVLWWLSPRWNWTTWKIRNGSWHVRGKIACLSSLSYSPDCLCVTKSVCEWITYILWQDPRNNMASLTMFQLQQLWICLLYLS